MVTWISALSKTRQKISAALARVFTRPDAADEETLEQLEELLLGADVPVRLVQELSVELHKGYGALRVSKREMLTRILEKALDQSAPVSWMEGEGRKPCCVLLVGVNGSGKTTTGAKLAHQVKQVGKTPLLCAADTFRAAGADQMRLWAERVGCDVVAGTQGADAAAVAYDAVDAGMARGVDVLFFDTAGRMHTKQPLMKELEKLTGVIGKRMPGAPHEVWIVLDAMLGHNAVVQAGQFHKTIPLTGAVITKLDGSAKAGFIFSITRELGIPIRYVGLGEGMEDLAPFNPKEFVEALLKTPDEVKA